MSLPILRLRVSGYCCAMINEEDKLIYYGASALQSLPITWYRKVSPKERQQGEEKNQEKIDSRDVKVNVNVSGESSGDDSRQRKSRPLRKSQTAGVVGVGVGVGSLSLVNAIFPQHSKSEDDSYVGIDANLSICDTDLGPAIEVRSTNSKEALEILEKYDILDFDKNLDTICNLCMDGNEEEEHVIQRTILLNDIDCAAAGGRWELGNMLQVGSGNFDCGIKVYSSADDFQLLGAGKKVLLFDNLKSCSLPKEDVISYINALVKWEYDRRTYAEMVHDDGIGEMCEPALRSVPKLCC